MADNVDVTQGRSNGMKSERCDTNNESTSIEETSSGIGNASSVGISNVGNLNFLVSEHEDEGEDMDDEATDNCSTVPTLSSGLRCAVPVLQNERNSSRNAPAEIPPEPTENHSGNSVASGDESDYSYDYEDEDDCHISGFLVPDPLPMEQQSATAIPQNIPAETDCSNANESSSKSCLSSKEPSLDPIPSSSSTLKSPGIKLDSNDKDLDVFSKKSSWKEPSQAAVNMSLRAESEKTGGKRRLASDLYKIMMNDTEDAGFSLEPASEDSMEKWKIKLFKFDTDSNLHKDLMALGLTHVELEMSFPDQYPFEPPFVRVVSPRFKRQTGFVMNGAICSELLTNEGWNPVNDIESVIVSIRSLLVVGNGRLEAAVGLSKNKTSLKRRGSELDSESDEERNDDEEEQDSKIGAEDNPDSEKKSKRRKVEMGSKKPKQGKLSVAGQYSAAEARSAYSHLSDYHKKKGWDSTGWWARKG